LILVYRWTDYQKPCGRPIPTSRRGTSAETVRKDPAIRKFFDILVQLRIAYIEFFLISFLFLSQYDVKLAASSIDDENVSNGTDYLLPQPLKVLFALE
jgi:hypothetical protein